MRDVSCKDRSSLFATVLRVGGDPIQQASESLAKRGWDGVRRHPYITGTFVVCIALGAAMGLMWLTGEWSVARRLLAGSVAGASTALLVTATKLFE